MSQTAPAQRSRTILGPLTTTFTPPASCATAAIEYSRVGEGDYPYLRNRGCGSKGKLYNDIPCWPPITTAVSQTGDNGQWGFYSPGLMCPSGYTATCSATAGIQSGFAFEFPLVSGETAVGCCPSGFSCSSGTAGQNCWSHAGYGSSFPVKTCSRGGWTKASMLSLPYTENGSITTTYPVHAPMIEIRWRSSDRETSSGESNSSSFGHAHTTDGERSRGSSLSTAAKIEIGVLVPILTIATFFAVTLLWRWRRWRRAQHLGGSKLIISEPKPLYDGVPLVRINQELDSSTRYEMEEHCAVKELDPHAAWSPQRHELPAEF